MSILSLMHQTMQVKTVRATRDSVGGQTLAKTVRATVRCLRTELTGQERELLGRQGVVATHRIFFEAGTTLSERDEIVIDGVTYDVMHVVNPHDLDKHKYADVKQRT